jgi:hypothetical protein
MRLHFGAGTLGPMAGSQNAMCIGAGLPDPEENSQPPGFALAVRLVGDLRAAGLAFSSPGNWRDVGWSSFCRTHDAWLELSLSAAASAQCILQLARMPPEVRPTVVRRETIARGRQLAYAAAQIVHASLAAVFSSVHWAVDADPSRSSARQPIAPGGDAR